MKFSFSKGVLPVLASLLVIVPSCEKQDEIVSVQLNESEISLEVGETHELAVTVSPEGAELIWSSSDEAIATVADGIVTAVAEGNAVITAACGEVKDECSVTVTAASIPVESVILDIMELGLNVSETATLTATVLPEDATDKTVVWTSSDEAVATVEDGVVTAVGEGEAEIIASAGGVEAKCAVTVTVIDYIAMGEDENFRLVIEYFFEEEGTKYVNLAWYPKDEEMVYFPFMVQATLYEGRTDEQFIEEYYTNLEMTAGFYGMTFEQYLANFLKTKDFSGASVVPSSEKYYGIAFGCEADGTPTTPILAVEFMGE